MGDCHAGNPQVYHWPTKNDKQSMAYIKGLGTTQFGRLRLLLGLSHTTKIAAKPLTKEAHQEDLEPSYVYKGFYYCCFNVGSVDKFVRDPNPISYDETPDSPSQPQTSLLNQRHCFHCKDPLEEHEHCKRCTCMRCGSGLSKGFCFICASSNKNSSQRLPNCPKCGDPIEGLYCQQCALIRKKLEEVFQDLQDNSESSNVVNAPQEPFVDYTIAITHVLSIEEPVDSLIIEDEHLDTIPATESDEVIKSSVELRIGIALSSTMMMMMTRTIPLQSHPDDDSPYDEDIDYVDASPPDAEIVSSEVVEIVILEVGGIDTDILLTIKDDILREKLLNVNLLIANIEALKDNPTPSSDFCLPLLGSDYSLPDYEAFYLDDDHIEEKSSGSTTTHANFSQYDLFIFDLSIDSFPPANRSDLYHEEFIGELAHIISLPEYDHFCFKIELELGNLTMDVVGDIFPTREPRVHVPNVLAPHPTLNLDLDFILFNDYLFAYIVWIFLPFLTYPVAPPYLLSCGNEDTIFDPGISVYHSFMPGVSHRSGTFIKFNVYPNHLNESPMEILSSTCSPMDQ
ncbi:hypothetical protein Tco_1143723 [Tanacetum coccineum]